MESIYKQGIRAKNTITLIPRAYSATKPDTEILLSSIFDLSCSQIRWQLWVWLKKKKKKSTYVLRIQWHILNWKSVTFSPGLKVILSHQSNCHGEFQAHEHCMSISRAGQLETCLDYPSAGEPDSWPLQIWSWYCRRRWKDTLTFPPCYFLDNSTRFKHRRETLN